MDVLKKAAESRRNARLNFDAEKEEDGDGAEGASGSGSRDERAVARPQPTVHEEKPIRMIFISTSDAEAGHARQLPWVMRGMKCQPRLGWRFSSTTHYRSSAKLPVGT